MSTNQRKCPDCGTIMSAPSQSPPTCLVCGTRIVSLQLVDQIAIQEGLGLTGRSSGESEGLAKHEFLRSATPNGDRHAEDIVRDERGSTVKREIASSAAQKQDARGEAKRDRERVAVSRILPEFNGLHNTSYSEVRSDEADEDVDVLVTWSGTSETDLKVQVVSIEPAEIRRKLSQSASLSEEISEKEATKRLADAIQGKNTRAAEDIVLVIDAIWPSVPGTLDLFVQQYAQVLDASPFAEIWYSGGGIGGVVRRLK